MSAASDPETEAGRLLDPNAPALARFTPLEKGGTIRVFLAARHDIVTEVLSDEATFSLRHYDALLSQVAGPVRYLVGENDANRKVRQRQLLAAQAHIDALRKAPPSGEPPNLASSYRTWIASLAREEAQGILAVLNARARTQEPVNFVREYAFLLGWRMARRIVGVPAPATPGWVARSIVYGRNLLRPGRCLPLKGEMGAATIALTLQQPLFGHVFGTVTLSTGLTPMLAKSTARHSLAAFDNAWQMPAIAEPTSLLAALRAVEGQFPDVADYATQARSVLFELTGALVLIVGNALSQIAGFATSRNGADSGIGWDTLLERLSDPTKADADHDATINEMLRLAGESRLVRTVRQDCRWRGIDLQAGDRILAMVNIASRDPAVFADPDNFAPDPARPYITSGPLQGTHVCYGRMMAWTIMREVLLATKGRIVPAKGAQLSTFLFMPDDLRFECVAPRSSAPTPTPNHIGQKDAAG